MKVRIHDRSFEPVKVYVAESIDDCKDATDISVYELVYQFQDVVAVGFVIGEPVSESKKTLDEHTKV